MFVHTLRTQLEMFLRVIEQLDATQVDVIAIDLPGHGESAAPPADYAAGYFTDAVEGLLEQLDFHKAVFAGESICASIGLILAARGNPRIAHVVAVNPYDYGRDDPYRCGSLPGPARGIPHSAGTGRAGSQPAAAAPRSRCR